jgi:hypothetical protein
MLILNGNAPQEVLTPHSDTPCAGFSLNLSHGPMVVEVAPGAQITVSSDLHPRYYVAEMDAPDPGGGHGGRYLILPARYEGTVPATYHAFMGRTNDVLLMLSAVPPVGDKAAAVALLKRVKIHPLHPPADWRDPVWIDVADP